MGTTGEGILLDRRRTADGDGALRRGGARPDPGRGPRRRADDGAERRARRARGEHRRRRRRGDRPAVLQARRRGPVPAPSRRPRGACASHAVLRLRARGRRRLPVRPRDAAAAARHAGQRRRHEGLRRAVGALRALPARGLRHPRRPRGADPSRDAGGSGRRRLGARGGVPGSRRRGGPESDRGGRRRACGTCARRSRPTQRHAALKRILARRGVPVQPDVRGRRCATSTRPSWRHSRGSAV